MTGRGQANDDVLEQLAALDTLVAERDDIATLLDRAAVLRATSQQVRTRTGMDLGYTAQQEDDDLLVIRGWSGDKQGSGLRNLEVPRGLGLGGKSFALVRPVWVPDYCESAQITHEFDSVIRSEGIGAMVAIPLLHSGAVIGVAYAARREAAQVGDVVIEQMAGIAAPAAAALHLAGRAHEHTLAAAAAERRRVAVALHDSVGAMLFSLGAEVHDLQCDAVTDPTLLRRLRDVERRISQTAAVFRESLAVLDEVEPQRALTATLRGDCDAFQARTAIVTRCVCLTDLPVLDDAHSAAIVAVVREAMLNVDKHARASSVVVSVAATGDGVAVAVADDGLGWPGSAEGLLDRAKTGDAAGPPAGIGLKSAHEKLARLGGTLSVVGNEDGGLTVRAWVPSW